MGFGVRPPQGPGIKAVVYEFLVLKIGESLFLQGDDNTYSTIIPNEDGWSFSIFASLGVVGQRRHCCAF